MLMDFFSSLSTGNVLFVTFIAAYTARRQLDKEPSTDAAAATDTGDVILKSDRDGDRSDNLEDQHDVPDRQRTSHSVVAEEVSLTGGSKHKMTLLFIEPCTLTTLHKDQTQRYLLTNISLSSSHSQHLNQLIPALNLVIAKTLACKYRAHKK